MRGANQKKTPARKLAVSGPTSLGGGIGRGGFGATEPLFTEPCDWVAAGVIGALLIKYRLNQRPLQVMWLLAKGRDKRKIADDLSLSIRTVENHIGDLNEALGTSNPIELLGLWISLSFEAATALGQYLPPRGSDEH